MRFSVVTLFPDIIKAYGEMSILGRAKEKKLIDVQTFNPRDYTKDQWRRVDQRPYGGGPGMVLEPVSVLKAADAALRKKGKTKILFLSASGKTFTNAYARTLVKKYDHLVIISGRYEGVDARVKKALKAEEVSIGEYVLTGGELPALVVIDAISRQIPGVLGTFESIEEERIASSEVYTRPEVITYKKKKYRVPKVLLSGHHQQIEEWKKGTRGKEDNRTISKG